MAQWHRQSFTAYRVDTLKDDYFLCVREEMPMPKPLFKSDEQWIEVIQACRTSGMTDKDWCSQNGISTSALYRHIRKLKAFDVPIPGHGEICTSEKHDVVPLRIAESESRAAFQANGSESAPFLQHLSCGIHISIGSFRIDVAGNADPAALQNTLQILQRIC